MAWSLGSPCHLPNRAPPSHLCNRPEAELPAPSSPPRPVGGRAPSAARASAPVQRRAPSARGRPRPRATRAVALGVAQKAPYSTIKLRWPNSIKYKLALVLIRLNSLGPTPTGSGPTIPRSLTQLIGWPSQQCTPPSLAEPRSPPCQSPRLASRPGPERRAARLTLATAGRRGASAAHLHPRARTLAAAPARRGRLSLGLYRAPATSRPR
jgi:hypothetical protein